MTKLVNFASLGWCQSDDQVQFKRFFEQILRTKCEFCYNFFYSSERSSNNLPFKKRFPDLFAMRTYFDCPNLILELTPNSI